MPKCEHCKYLERTSYEYGEYECAIFGCDNDGNMFTDEGCKYHWKTLEKEYNMILEHQNSYYDGFVKWHQERCNTIETCYICGKETTGDNTTNCDSNTNFVDEPCGETICYSCWNRERIKSIYDNKIPDCCLKKRNESKGVEIK